MFERFKKIFAAHGYEAKLNDGWSNPKTICTVSGDKRELTKLVKILFETEPEWKFYLDNVKYRWGFSDLFKRHSNRLVISKS